MTTSRGRVFYQQSVPCSRKVSGALICPEHSTLQYLVFSSRLQCGDHNRHVYMCRC